MLARRRGRLGLGGLLLCNLDGPPAYVEGAARVAADLGYLAAGELDGVGEDDVAGDAVEAGLDDCDELLVRVAGEGDSG